MIVDAATLPDGTIIEADFCVIGGGIVALTIARELRSAGASILILESGGLQPDERSQDLYRGSATLTGPIGPGLDMPDYLIQSRARYFGGSGNVWAGKCGVLEEVDFEARPWVPNSGWPFSRAHLEPWYDRACDQLEIPRLTRPMAELVDAARPELPFVAGSPLVTEARFHTAFTGRRGSRFQEWKDAVTSAPAVRTCINANVTAIRLDPTGRRVESLVVRCLDGRSHVARARRYLLATGGLENVRLLLQSNDVHRDGIGNDRGLVGRCFIGHTNFAEYGAVPTGVAFTQPLAPFTLYTGDDLAHTWGIIGTTREAQRRARLPNFWGTFSEESPGTDAGATQAVSAFRGLQGNAPAATPTFVPIRFMVELEAHPTSRVELVQERDALGQRRLHLDWRLTPGDGDGLQRSVELFARAIGGEGIGRLRWGVEPAHLARLASPARHHMGTTRMHADPARGVVDPDCRVHGIDNLWIGGSSVFPTGGCANATLTIMALTLRLADHLRPVLAS